MREIKFRAWVGKMEYNITTGKFGTFCVNPVNDGLHPGDRASLTPNTTKYPDDVPVMQYTGLKDKYGKEVYEGDIIKSTRFGLLGEVKFWDEYGLYGFDHMPYFGKSKDTTRPRGSIGSSTSYRPYNWKSFGKKEVIGNIYENPELLQDPISSNER